VFPAVPPLNLAGSIAVLVLTGLGVIWPGGRICRIGIFATGQRATPVEDGRWIRTA
jgi:hypothetical protein